MNNRPSIDTIKRLVAPAFGVSVCDLDSHRRDASTALGRHVAMFLAREMTLSSLPAIGRRFGDKDHTTVMYAVRRIRRLVAAESGMAAVVAGLRSALTPTQREDAA